MAERARFSFNSSASGGQISIHFGSHEEEVKNSHDCLSVHLRKKQEQPLFIQLQHIKTQQKLQFEVAHSSLCNYPTTCSQSRAIFLPWAFIFQLYLANVIKELVKLFANCISRSLSSGIISKLPSN